MRRFISTTVLLTLSSTALAQFQVGIKAETGYWQTGVDGDAIGMLAGANLGYQHGRFFTGINYLGGDYSIDGKGVDITRTDTDASIGYIINPTYNVFAGFKKTEIDYVNNDTDIEYQEIIDTLGLGGSMIQPVNDKWTLVGTASLHLPQSHYQEFDFSTDSEGYGQSMIATLAYRINKQANASASFRFQSFMVEYEDGFSLTTQLWQLGGNIAYSF